LRAALGSCQGFGLYSTDSCMATCVLSIQHRQLYGKLCFVYTALTGVIATCLVCTAQTTVWQFVCGLYSTDSCIATCVWSVQHRLLYDNLCLICTAQTAVWQVLFGLYSTDSCMETCIWSVQHRQLYGNLCLVYTAQTAVWQLVFGLYSTDSFMAICLVCRAQTALWQLVFGLYSTDSCMVTCVCSIHTDSCMPTSFQQITHFSIKYCILHHYCQYYIH